MNMFKDLKEDVNKYINEIYEHTNSGMNGRKQLEI